MDDATLRMLIEMARERRDAASGRKAEAQRDADAAAATLRTLDDYRGQALANGPVRDGAALEVAQLRTLDAFGCRLDAAIASQRGACEQRDAVVADRAQHLGDAQRRLQALELLESRRRAERLAAEERRSQRDNDEFAARAARRGASR